MQEQISWMAPKVSKLFGSKVTFRTLAVKNRKRDNLRKELSCGSNLIVIKERILTYGTSDKLYDTL